MKLDKDPIYENPFSSFYLAEQFVRKTESIIKKGLLSPESFKISELTSLVTEPMNHFVTGVPGSGKTMILAFLRVECLAFINQNPKFKNQFKNVWPHIGSKLWGIYHGLLENEEFLSPQNFKGFGLDDQTWTNIYSDFLNMLYLKSMLKHVELSVSDSNHYISKWLNFNDKEDEVKLAILEFSKNLELPVECNNLEGLLSWTKNRLRLYQRMIKERSTPKIEIEDLPTSNFYRDVGYLPLRLVQQLRKFNVIDADQKIMFIIDEYDQCALANRPLFARAINSFVKSTARGAIDNVFVNVGSRPHGFHDKRVHDADGHSKIEDGRDYKNIDLLTLFKSNEAVFRQLIIDIGNRRIRNIEWFKKRKITNIKSLFDNVKPLEEGELYRTDKSDPDLLFKTMVLFCRPFKDSSAICLELTELIKELVTKAIHQKYLVIVACRQLKRAKNLNEEDAQKLIIKLKEDLREIGEFINIGGKLKDNSKLFYKLKDLREPALFQLSSEYRQLKYYCGLESIRLMAEGVPLNFIKLSRAIFDELRYKIAEFEKTMKIDIRWQNRAIRKVANETRIEASSDLSRGQSFIILLDELGFIFRRMQLSPTAPYPTPNGFSLETDQDWLIRQESDIDQGPPSDSKEYLATILRDACDWGHLIAKMHKSKAKSQKNRTKYNISSMFSPYYDLSVRHLKEPYYSTFEELINLSSPDLNIRSKYRKSILNRIPSLKIFQKTL